jgi:hypothetical protein
VPERSVADERPRTLSLTCRWTCPCPCPSSPRPGPACFGFVLSRQVVALPGDSTKRRCQSSRGLSRNCRSVHPGSLTTLGHARKARSIPQRPSDRRDREEDERPENLPARRPCSSGSWSSRFVAVLRSARTSGRSSNTRSRAIGRCGRPSPTRRRRVRVVSDLTASCLFARYNLPSLDMEQARVPGRATRRRLA